MDEKKMDKTDQKDPLIEQGMDQKVDMKGADQAESSMDGPNLIDPGEETNKSQDEGKVYDL
jgi:hypothetical protein